MNRLWLEIERDADEAINHERAEKLTNLLGKLGYPYDVYFSEWDRHYRLETSDAGTFLKLTDSGHWFDLDWFNDRH
jgi:hypothetical protein